MSLRDLPQVDAVLRACDTTTFGAAVLARLAREEIARARRAVIAGEDAPDVEEIARAVSERAEGLLGARLGPVINATGVILHTNLGRAPLSQAAIEAATGAAGPTALEIDLDSGRRGVRAPLAPFLAAALTGAEAAHVVNNNAATLVLALAALARGREVIVSRGEMIEIGGEFRLPELMESSGAILREVGTTNRTHAKDYRRALSERTAMILKVHPSNYRVVGFTAAPSVGECASIAREQGVPLCYDIGSGLLAPDARLEGEPDATGAIEAGADLVCFSGDKLLGGPQSGILIGRSDLIETCKRHPLARALRADKLTLAALEATLLSRARGEPTPVDEMLSADTRERAEALSARVPGSRVVEGSSVAGGGSVPGMEIPTPIIEIPHPKPQDVLARLRRGSPPVVATIGNDAVLVDLRTVRAEHDAQLAEALMEATT